MSAAQSVWVPLVSSLLLAACFLVAAVPWTDEIGFAATVLFVLWHLWRTRQVRRAAAPA